jgi:hypothetical protein
MMLKPFEVKTTHRYEIGACSTPAKITRIEPNHKFLAPQEHEYSSANHTITYDGLKTIARFDDGSTGIAVCKKEDEWNQQIGRDIAYFRARIAQYEKKIEQAVATVVPSKKATLLKQIKETEDKIKEMKKEVSML